MFREVLQMVRLRSIVRANIFALRAGRGSRYCAGRVADARQKNQISAIITEWN